MLDSPPIKFVSLQFQVIGAVKSGLTLAANQSPIPVLMYQAVCTEGKLWRKVCPMGQEESEGWAQWY